MQIDPERLEELTELFAESNNTELLNGHLALRSTRRSSARLGYDTSEVDAEIALWDAEITRRGLVPRKSGRYAKAAEPEPEEASEEQASTFRM